MRFIFSNSTIELYNSRFLAVEWIKIEAENKNSKEKKSHSKISLTPKQATKEAAEETANQIVHRTSEWAQQAIDVIEQTRCARISGKNGLHGSDDIAQNRLEVRRDVAQNSLNMVDDAGLNFCSYL